MLVARTIVLFVFLCVARAASAGELVPLGYALHQRLAEDSRKGHRHRRSRPGKLPKALGRETSQLPQVNSRLWAVCRSSHGAP